MNYLKQLEKITNYKSEENLQIRLRCRNYVEQYHNPEILASKLIEIIINSLK